MCFRRRRRALRFRGISRKGNIIQRIVLGPISGHDNRVRVRQRNRGNATTFDKVRGGVSLTND
ncbi:hypothetical protein DL897_04705 [Thermoflavimicrobium daqui]|uniref:Uncharacterized protein n=1 Tax=Thermoflavimicrobium daqui TaxID=2137476 RepID=A0A364K7M6_9BACL|nr:hypothetical protein DL897_04705 [Thermoflavimicrobium daqui]